MNLVAQLHRRAAIHPERTALIDTRRGRERAIGFGELSRRVSAGAARLRELGLGRGQTALVLHPVSLELYEFMLAAFHAGIRVMLADPAAGREFLARCCGRLPPDAFFGSWQAQCLRLAVPALRAIPRAVRARAWFPGTTRWHTRQPGIPALELPADEPALITFTSGSTGPPKAAARSHGFLLAQHRTLAKALELREGETDLVTLPVFVLANLASGLTSVIAATDLRRPGTPDADSIHRQCLRHHITRCTASPAFFQGLLASPRGIPPFRKLFTGGAPVFPDLVQQLRAALPAASICSVYGSTEAEPIAHLPDAGCDAEMLEKTSRGAGLCAGLPVAEISVAILHDQWGTPLGPLTTAEFEALAVPPGHAGEIVVAGPHVLTGYLGGIGDQETKIRVGDRVWHRTGDAGWLDPAGRLWLLGRCAAKLPEHPAPADLPHGALRYPFAIECALREPHPGTRTAALAWQGQRTLAVAGLDDPAAKAAIEHDAARLGIRRVVHLPTLPLDHRHQAKIDYAALGKMLEARAREIDN